MTKRHVAAEGFRTLRSICGLGEERGFRERTKMESSFEQTLQDAKLYREINSLIVAYLRDNNLRQVTKVLIFFIALISSSGLRQWFSFGLVIKGVNLTQLRPHKHLGLPKFQSFWGFG